jgi:adenosylhomocysteine nucleosidase
MPMEMAPLRRRLRLEPGRFGAFEAHFGSQGNKRVVGTVTGMGTELATRGTERLLSGIEVERVIVVGITGALENETPIGTLVVPEEVVDGATGASYKPDHIGPSKPEGKMWTTDRLITDAETLARLSERGVVALDMETAAIAEVCERRRVPWSVFRVISDRASDGSVTEEVFGMANQDGTPNPRAVARFLLRHPTRLPRMLNLAAGSALATRRAAEAAISALSAPSQAG